MKSNRDIFKTITCPECGGSFKRIPGEENYRCSVCQSYEAYELEGHVYFVSRFGDMENDYDEANFSDNRPIACGTCGSDTYPDCMDSCSLFDD